MASMPKMKTTVDLHVSGNGLRVAAMGFATELACASINVGNSFQVSDMKMTADEILEWLERGPQTLGQGDTDAG